MRVGGIWPHLFASFSKTVLPRGCPRTHQDAPARSGRRWPVLRPGRLSWGNVGVRRSARGTAGRLSGPESCSRSRRRERGGGRGVRRARAGEQRRAARFGDGLGLGQIGNSAVAHSANAVPPPLSLFSLELGAVGGVLAGDRPSAGQGVALELSDARLGEQP
jgi:hypothetical protein